MPRTEIEIVIHVDHDADVDDDMLAAACENIGGFVLIEGKPAGWDAENKQVVLKGYAIVDEVYTVWVKGDA